MTKYLIPVSTTQAIVGAIIGWNFFTGHKTDSGLLSTIVTTWIAGPLLGAAFSAVLYILFRRLLMRLQVHLLILDAYIKWGLIIVGAFGAYSLGANNIANVMGVFVGSAPDIVIDLGLFTLDGPQVLFLLGGIAIAIGIMTYSKNLMIEVGNGIMALTAESCNSCCTFPGDSSFPVLFNLILEPAGRHRPASHPPRSCILLPGYRRFDNRNRTW
ncbi:MAG: inorganic phosphate transporter [Marinilabiliales bacterium]|nr:inorganic phosphate transporter [Marinilabiliales bacterium]